MLNTNKAEFIKSAAVEAQFIKSSVPNIVFAGKSNVGKSSVINRLLNRNNFARVASTPGKTVHVNYFLIDGSAYFIDLPGYGFARVSDAEKLRWAELMESFFKCSEISLGILIVDSRHNPTRDDISMCDWFVNSGCRFAVVANKTDKLKKSEISGKLEMIKACLGLDDEVPVIPFSAEKGEGRNELLRLIEGAL